jgi:hypothetical protein
MLLLFYTFTSPPSLPHIFIVPPPGGGALLAFGETIPPMNSKKAFQICVQKINYGYLPTSNLYIQIYI